MRTRVSLSIASLAAITLSLAAAGCGQPIENGYEDDNTRQAEVRGTWHPLNGLPLCRWWGGQLTAYPAMSQPAMQHLYYDINPRPHSEAAYQQGDVPPVIGARPTYADRTGSLTVLVTTLYNKSPSLGVSFGSTASFTVRDQNKVALCADAAPVPFRLDMPNVIAGQAFYIEPDTLDTMAKLLPTDLAK